MIQIQCGRFKGKKIDVPNINTVKPTKNIVRAAIFNMLRHRIDLCEYGFCDVFAGSGIIGFEALSLGCNPIYFYDVSKVVCDNLKKTVRLQFKGEKIIIRNKNALNDGSLFSKIPGKMVFFLDPPYTETELIYRFTDRVAMSGVNSIILIESNTGLELNRLQYFKLLNQKQYGYSKIFFLSH